MRIGLLFIVGLALCACGQKRSQPTARTSTPAPVAMPPQADPSTQTEPPEKRPRLGEAAVYVDGKPVGVLRRQELPSKLNARIVKLGEFEVKEYSITDYITALGVDVKKVKAAHLYGGQRVVIVDTAEWKRIGSGIVFSFTQGDRGKPRVDFPPVKLNVNTTIEMLSGMAFYVEKEPPHLEDGKLVMPDGTPVKDKVPYAPEEQGNGTRVYVDGALVGTVKRKKLTDDVVAPKDANAKESDPTKFLLVGYAGKLAPLSADVKNAKAVDLLAGDDVVAHLAPESAKGITFYVPSRNRGQALVDVPQGDAGPSSSTRPARVSAVQIYVKTSPPPRPVVPVDDAAEATPNANVGTGPEGDEP
jgi:hypothetical protein